jgi:hypothetical protein
MREQLARLHLASRETGGVMLVPRMLSADE